MRQPDGGSGMKARADLADTPDLTAGTRLRARGRLRGLVAVLLAAFAFSVAVPPVPADAATYGYVYISLPTWKGNCNWGSLGRVTIISGTVSNVSSVSMDRGDDLVYMKVKLGEYNRVQFTAFCNKWPGWWQPGFTTSIRPTRNNQTVWIGPGAGPSYN
jgi:hypothetical protein